MNCKICNKPAQERFRHLVLNKYEVKYYYCSDCIFLQTEEPYWLEEAYAKPIDDSDTGYVSRNIYLARRTLTFFFALFSLKKTFLDYAGGYGILTRLMRDYGLDFLWSDLYTKNLFAPGFEYHNQKIEALTCFECFEHFVSPVIDLEKLLKISENIFFSTRLLPTPLPPPEAWDYYGFKHGQHLSFYSSQTLSILAIKNNLNYYSDGKNLHLFTTKKISNLYFKLIMIISRLPLEFILKRILGSK